jgi:hypothetical protein
MGAGPGIESWRQKPRPSCRGVTPGFRAHLRRCGQRYGLLRSDLPQSVSISSASFNMTLFPVELLEKVIKLLYVSEHRSPAALGPVSLSSRCANKLAQKLQFQTASISTYRDLVIYQEILDGAPHLFQCIKTLRVSRAVEEENDDPVVPHFLSSCVGSFVLNEFAHPYYLYRAESYPPPFY